MGTRTPALRALFTLTAIAIVVACSGGSDASTPVDAETAVPAELATSVSSPTPVSPAPTVTPAQLIGVRGATHLDNPVFPSFGNGGYDVLHYDLDLNADLAANTLDGVATIDATAIQNLSAFNFDFAGPTISSVQVNGEPAGFTHEDLELNIEPASVIPDGSEFTVRVEYGGTPEPLFLPDFPFAQGWTVFGNSVIAHGRGFAVYPSNETPTDKATFTVRLTVPQPLVATATGELTGTIDNGDTTTYVWEATDPIGRAFFSISDSVLDVVEGPDGLAINNYFPSGFSENSKDSFDIVPEIIELFNELFGPFPFNSFGLTFLQGNLPFTGFAPPQRAFVLSGGGRFLAHEVAHQWFGGSVTPLTESDNWLDEGFGTYAGLLWEEHEFGTDAVTNGARSIRRRIGDTTRPPAIAETAADVLDSAAYERGALTLHALRLKLGDDDFFEVLRTYTGRFKHSAASTADFISVAEEVSQQDLAQFFDDWVYSEPVPPLDE